MRQPEIDFQGSMNLGLMLGRIEGEVRMVRETNTWIAQKVDSMDDRLRQLEASAGGRSEKRDEPKDESQALERVKNVAAWVLPAATLWALGAKDAAIEIIKAAAGR